MAKRDIDFLFEIGSLRHVSRAWRQVLDRNYVTRHDKLAERHMFQDTVLEKEAELLLEEYNDRKSLEAKIVKDADNLDVDFELEELAQMGNAIAVDMQQGHRFVVRAKKLYTKTAQRMWDGIRKADSNTWHRGLTNEWLNNSKGAK